MKKKNPELDFSPQANMLHLLKSAKSMALSSPKRNAVLLQPNILDVMSGKGTITLVHLTAYSVHLFCVFYLLTEQVDMAPFLTRTEVPLPFLNSLRMHI